MRRLVKRIVSFSRFLIVTVPAPAAVIPSEVNPRTGKITALSVIAALRGLTATLKVGS